jgi:endoglucanase
MPGIVTESGQNIGEWLRVALHRSIAFPMRKQSTLGAARHIPFLIGALAYLLNCGVSSADNIIFARGINLSGAELNCERTRAVSGKDYIYPPQQDLDYYVSKGFAVVRLPYCWERLQHSLFGDLDSSELGRITNFLAAAHARKMRVILSPHNYGRYRIADKDVVIGSPTVPSEAFADFSKKVAAAFASNDSVYALSLMNEPHDSNGMWKRIAQDALNAIRRVDHERVILAPGDQWSGAWSWKRFNNDFLLDDPAGRIMYEAHQYFDLNHSGTYKVGYSLNGATPDRGVEWVRPFAEWLKQHGQQGIITEFGVPNNDARWLELVQQMLAYLATEKIPWAYWAGGPWWGNYPLSAEPKNGVDAPIMATLTKDYGMLRP